jgi:uncharacterized protein YkwD
LSGELLMRESSPIGRGNIRPGKPRGVVIQMPTPKAVRRRRAVRVGMIFLGLALAAAIAARIYLNEELPRSAEQIAGVNPEESRIMLLVNRERIKAGLAELKLSARLAVAARGHSYDMALRHYFSHQSADGVSPEQRIRGSGIDYAEVGENIYMEDYPDHERLAERAVKGWLGSPGHRKNMLSPVFTEAGVGLARAADGSTYVTQDFIRSESR